MDYKDYFLKLRRAINRGREVIIRNPEGEELNISSDLNDAIFEYRMAQDEEKIKEKLKKKDEKIEALINELVETKKELHRVKGIKKELDERKLRYRLFMDSEEGKMTKRLIDKRIDDPDIEPYKDKINKLKNTKINEEDYEMSEDESEKLRKQLEKKYKEK